MITNNNIDIILYLLYLIITIIHIIVIICCIIMIIMFRNIIKYLEKITENNEVITVIYNKFDNTSKILKNVVSAIKYF